ncbi:MAG: nucleoside-triphosphatase [Bacteroidetes bacterium]|nr:nucleoside-triphosphatase [Bacteroidota bacterium]MBU1114088.1 nucleoside-triphosphatase [Bacteroidota bacterium]MBU1798864.1 nucleoside-triphosphatase [Bacteroidota bacterium]
MSKIKIITGKIRSGKTTFLMNLISSLNEVEGILQPSVGENRFFYHIKSNEFKEITSNVEDETTFRIGKFVFSNESFSWAKMILQKAIRNKDKTIIIDEYGPLEQDGKGLEPEVSEIVAIVKNENNRNLIIAIREALVDEFLLKFHLNKSEVEIIKIEINQEF